MANTSLIEAATAYDVFLAHNSADKEAVARIAEHLRRERIEPWLDRWNLTPGDRWQPGIVQGLRTSRACAVLIGPSGLGDWAREELAVAQDRAAKDPEFRLFMVLLPGAPDPFDASLAFLTTRTWVDMRDGVADTDGFQDLIAAITGVARRPEVVSSDTPEVCPYRGLEAFDAEHVDFFFGREEDTLRVLEKLRTSRFLAVLGASGSGKSSLVRAGAVPALHRGALPDSDGWTVRMFTPGARPLSLLAAQVARLFPAESMQRTLDQMRTDERTLDLAVSLAMADRPAGERVVIVVDQFEEVFTLCADVQEREAFLSNLLHAATIPAGRVVVIVAMRADFYHHCAEHPQLRALIAGQQFLVGPLGPEALRRVIEEPARRVGLEPEAGLVKTILGDVAGRPGTLPLLSHVLLELWKARRGRMLTLEAYVATGGVEGALAARANATYSSLSVEDQRVARRVLLRLTQPGEGTEDTRRRATIAELMTAADEQQDVKSVVDALAKDRLVTVGTDELSGAETVDVTHEALIRGWPLLRTWINEDREQLRAHRRLSDAAREWDENGRDESLLYRGGRLATWQDRDETALNALEGDFLQASRRRESRERAAGHRRTELAAIALAVAVIVISTVAVVAIGQGHHAADQRDLAYARQLAASASEQLSTDPQLSLLLALQAYKVAPIPEAEAVVRQATLESDVRASIQMPDQARLARFSPDNSRVAIAVVDGTVQLWDWAGRTPPVVLRGHEGVVQSLAFSPDGHLLATGGTDSTVRVWDLVGRSDPVILRGAGPPVESVAFSPDGRQLVAVGDEGTVRLWQVGSQAPPLVLADHLGPLMGAAFSPDGRRIATSGADGAIRVWDLDGTQTLATNAKYGLGLSVAFSPDGTLLVSAGADNTVRIWDAATGAAVAVLRGHSSTVFTASFSPDGREVLSASGDGTVRIWDWAGGGSTRILRGHAGYVFSAFFSSDGRLAVSAGADGRAQVWDLSSAGQGVVLSTHTYRVIGVAFSDDGVHVATGGDDGVVRVWDLRHPADPVQLPGQQGAIYAVTFSHDGRVASAGTDGTVRIWDLAHPDPPVVLRGHEGVVFSVAFSPDGRRIASAGADQTVRVWDLAHPDDPLVLTGNQFSVLAVTFSPDGARVASGGVDGTVRVWDLSRPVTPIVLTGHGAFVLDVAFSPDGKRLLSGGGDGTLRLWNADGTGRPTVLSGDQGTILNVAFRPDGQLLSSGSDGTIRVTDPTGASKPISIRGTEEGVQRAPFATDGNRIASAGVDGTVVVWTCEVCGPLRDVLALARSRVVRQLTPAERAKYLGHK